MELFTFARSETACDTSNLDVDCAPARRSNLLTHSSLVRVPVGGDQRRVEIHLIAHPDDDQPEARRLLKKQFASFDAGKARCFLASDRERLLAVIEAGFGDFHDFNRVARSLSASPPLGIFVKCGSRTPGADGGIFIPTRLTYTGSPPALPWACLPPYLGVAPCPTPSLLYTVTPYRQPLRRGALYPAPTKTSSSRFAFGAAFWPYPCQRGARRSYRTPVPYSPTPHCPRPSASAAASASASAAAAAAAAAAAPGPGLGLAGTAWACPYCPVPGGCLSAPSRYRTW
eukprot:scaffold62300_cov75-Phaeocystis_antarctica.AAC.1